MTVRYLLFDFFWFDKGFFNGILNLFLMEIALFLMTIQLIDLH